MKVEWTKLEYPNATPSEDCNGFLLWVVEEYYELGVAVGRYTTKGGWEYTSDGGDWYDDCSITYYAKLALPEEPEEF